MKYYLSLLIIFTFLLSGCGPQVVNIPKGATAEQIYNIGYDLVKDGKYVKANGIFNKIAVDKVGSAIGIKAKTMLVYTYYMSGNYFDAIAEAEDFLKVYKNNPDIDYIYYLYALSFFEQVADVRRDQLLSK